eukprot:CAMPEP_0172734480 /NCGR_PEP_ID=MMETSP1074-20121228/110016_1 /TAXON_ID=2916 /ORGANISM="Ceratium fusus, Strain PA161109" /LENGTH=61 /DNA_ID=CAMNT_0013563271 /DNA_START=43 /DNA_END=226 /DNA_ORIENTATION=-
MMRGTNLTTTTITATQQNRGEFQSGSELQFEEERNKCSGSVTYKSNERAATAGKRKDGGEH